MKILFSAYVVDPNTGGEPQMAWNWIYGAVKSGHEVAVITDEDSRIRILEYASDLKLVNFKIFVIPSKRSTKFLPGIIGLYVNYLIWQLKIPRLIRQNSLMSYDLAHHTSWGNISLGSGFAFSSLPYVIGPAGGGSFGNNKLRGFYGKYWILELIRNSLLNSIFFSWFGKITCKRASLVLVTNNATFERAKKFKSKEVKMFLADAIPENLISERVDRPSVKNVIFVARFLPRKGANLAIFSFNEVLKVIPDANLVMIGYGPLLKSTRKKVESLGMQSNVVFEGRLQWSRVQSKLSTGQVFLFPSLRDSSGAQVIESAAKGTPIVALDNGGVSDWIHEPGLFKVNIGDRKQTIQNMSEKIIKILNMTDEKWFEASRALTNFARKHTVELNVKNMNEFYNRINNEKRN
jgi:glycosyltransferase involved in cell wall biosynthesis